VVSHVRSGVEWHVSQKVRSFAVTSTVAGTDGGAMELTMLGAIAEPCGVWQVSQTIPVPDAGGAIAAWAVWFHSDRLGNPLPERGTWQVAQ
jgi:hypothetical protein